MLLCCWAGFIIGSTIIAVQTKELATLGIHTITACMSLYVTHLMDPTCSNLSLILMLVVLL